MREVRRTVADVRVEIEEAGRKESGSESKPDGE